MSADKTFEKSTSRFSLSHVFGGEGRGEERGALDRSEPVDSPNRANLRIDRFTAVSHRSPLSPALSPAYREEGGRDHHSHAAAGDRKRLAQQQAALVQALAGQSDAPEGFDLDRVSIAVGSLFAKRRRGVEKTWPELAASLGDRFREAFDAYARSQTIPAEGPVADGRLFARDLCRLGQLSDAGRVQLLLSEMGRRPVGFAYLSGSREVVVAFRSRRGARWFTLRFPGPRRPDFSQQLEPPLK